MALQKRKISQLPPAGPITGSELVEVVQGGQNRRALASQFSGGGGGGPVAWGGIIGNIDTQSDLIARFSQYTMNTDPRLSDAREWTAETVSQAEAEAGTSTTRRAWTPQRVRQSIEFFWESATTPFGRVLAQTPSASTARGSLELGDSATRNVGTTAGTVAAGDDPRFGGGGGATSWGSILGDIEDQTDLTSALALKVDDGDPRLSDARTPTAHTHPISDVVGLQGELDSKEFALTAGANITIDRTNPAAPVISSSGGGGSADWGDIGGDLSDQTDLQNALDAKVSRNSIIGTVSESGGAPTGAIIESGANSNGEYVRFADGTQICAIGSLYLSRSGSAVCAETWNFPAAFDATYSISPSAVLIGSQPESTPGVDELASTTSSFPTSVSATIRQYRSVGATDFQTGDRIRVAAFAIGRWF